VPLPAAWLDADRLGKHRRAAIVRP
jgi:hypothetical protein